MGVGVKRSLSGGRNDTLHPSKKVKRESLRPGTQFKDSGSTTFEENTVGSPNNYNRISRLLDHIRASEVIDLAESQPAVSLCSIFSRLLSKGKLQSADGAGEHQLVITRWLNERFVEYSDLLLGEIRSVRDHRRTSVLDIIMLLAKEEINSSPRGRHFPHESGLFAKLLKTILGTRIERQWVIGFINEYLLPYRDIELFTLQLLK